jgi:predicted esterase
MRRAVLTSIALVTLAACGRSNPDATASAGTPADEGANANQGANAPASTNAGANGSTHANAHPNAVANANANADAGANADASSSASTDPGTSSNPGASTDPGATPDPGATSDPGSSTPAPTPAPAPSPIDDPGSKPTASCPLTKDSAGFFTRTTANASYVGYVPASYDGTKPVRLVVALHGCGDSAYNFATWGANPYDTRATQQHIGISVDGASAARGCWSMGGDDAKVLAAIDDAMSCFWIHKHEVVLAGFSSGGELAYRVAMMNASRFSGLLIESSAAYASSSDENALFTGASWKFPIAHVQHSSDTVFPLASVQADWAKLTADGFPLQTEVTAGAHDGTSTDWAGWLIPHAAGWLSP